ncbi:uncharacterized protein JOC70_003354 [Clostridium pascui]|uniref:radical SAM/SPASM domain-containing protein n=1 Tax=Clostridium pascui TaxID=46609 RepID=UPI00195C32EB|nr:radical SAM protein [Clostridium pascui]MBM7871842.1 uncharacterized protein [Clostridium pascui]
MKKNKYTVGFKIKNNNILFNSLYGTVDIIENENLYNNIIANKLNYIDNDLLQELFLRKYITREDDISLVKSLYLKSKDTNKNKGRFYIVFSYLCNFKCPYCFEKDINDVNSMDMLKLENVLRCIRELIATYKLEESEINLYGGEPLLLINKDLINRVFEFARLNNIKISVITNGSNIKNYISILEEYKKIINVISITIDGPKENNDLRRIYKNGTGSYDKIIESIQLLGEHNIKTSVRVNIDKSYKFSYLEFIQKLYSDIGHSIDVNLFKVEDNRCLGNIEEIMSDKDIVSEFNCEEVQYIFDNYSVNSCVKHYNQIKNLIDNEELILPLFKYCKVGNLFTFDPSGSIFICPEATGDNKFTLGKYYPEIEIDKSKIEELLNLSITNVDKCSNCDLSPICGMGCPYESFNFTNNIKNPRCKYDDIYKAVEEYIETKYIK